MHRRQFASIGTPRTVWDLDAQYRVHELTQEKKSFSTIDNIAIYSDVVSDLVGGVFGSVLFGHEGRGVVALASVSSNFKIETEVHSVNALQPRDPA